MKTLTPLGLSKQMTRFAESLSHATYEHEAHTKEISFSKEVSEDSVKIIVIFDENISGQIGNVKLIDQEGDVVAHAGRIFIKPAAKSLYVAFRYKLIETEVD
ncbi:hypothetical protein V3851_23665 [Paenibacillus sp. M1]|uniref:Uncharacterized protein n=1 Tax=Paenibacillus haidiansis TaxID=1574488 RepID=A0ABU7VYF7_9BACL